MNEIYELSLKQFCTQKNTLSSRSSQSGAINFLSVVIIMWYCSFGFVVSHICWCTMYTRRSSTALSLSLSLLCIAFHSVQQKSIKNDDGNCLERERTICVDKMSNTLPSSNFQQATHRYPGSPSPNDTIAFPTTNSMRNLWTLASRYVNFDCFLFSVTLAAFRLLWLIYTFFSWSVTT